MSRDREHIVYAKLEDLTPENGWIKLHGALRRENPELDDLTARCVNRLGGWFTLLDQYQDGAFFKRKTEFFSLWKEFLDLKMQGFYVSDRLPLITAYEQAYRVLIKSESKNVQG